MKNKTREERKHLELVAQLPCVVCGTKPVEVHHCIGSRFGSGMGQRSSHFHTLPLCVSHHRTGDFGHAVHNGTRTFEENYDTQDELLKKTIRKLYGDSFNPEHGNFNFYL